MGHFITTDTWGRFPHSIIGTISAYNAGAISLNRALEIVSSKLSSRVHIEYTYDVTGNKVPKSVISFGAPATVHFIFD